MTGQTTDPGTGGPLEDAVLKHAGILAPDEDNQDEGEAKAKEKAESADEETEDDAVVGDPDEDTDDEAEDEDDEEADESDEDGEDDNDDEDDEDDDSERTFKVKVDGEEVEVTESELIAGYTRHADYTRKTTALANERKEFESEVESVRAERQQYAELLPKLKERLEKDGEQEPDWDRLYREDPDEWVRKRELWRSRRERLQAVEAEEERVRQQQEADNQVRLKAFVAEQSEKLASAIPEWADEKKAKAEKQAIAAYARDKLGYSDEELSQIFDHRAVVALRNAMLFEQAKSQTGKAAKGKRKGPKTAKPGAPKSGKTSQSRAEKERRQRFAHSGSVDDAADVLLDYVD